MKQLTIAINSSNVKDYSSSFLKEFLGQKKQLLTSARASARPFISNEVEEIEKELAAREHEENLRVEERTKEIIEASLNPYKEKIKNSKNHWQSRRRRMKRSQTKINSVIRYDNSHQHSST